MDLSNNEKSPKLRLMLENIEDSSVLFQYSFYSSIGSSIPVHFKKNHWIDIIVESQFGSAIEIIGRVDFLILYLEKAVKLNRDLLEGEGWLPEDFNYIISKTLNPSKTDFSKEVKQHFRTQLDRRNICVIESISILPKFRGYQVALKAVKDIIESYSDMCTLFVMQTWAPQFDRTPIIEILADLDLELSEFTETEEDSIKKLNNYFKSMGFEEVKGIPDLLFLNPAIPNAQFETLDLDENPVFRSK